MTDTSSLLLLNDTLNDYVGSQGGMIQVDGTHDGSGTGATLELQNTTIDGGTIDNAGLIQGIVGASFIDNANINNFGSGFIDANGVNFTIDPSTITNDGTLEATNGGTLVLSQDNVTNTGTVLVDATTGSTLDLTGSDTINGGQINNAGLIKVTGTGNLIENETGGTNSFTNTGTLEVAGTLTLTSDLVTNNSGTIKVDKTDTLNVDNTTIAGGALALFGFSKAQVVGGNIVIPGVSIQDLISSTKLTLTIVANGGSILLGQLPG